MRSDFIVVYWWCFEDYVENHRVFTDLDSFKQFVDKLYTDSSVAKVKVLF